MNSIKSSSKFSPFKLILASSVMNVQGDNLLANPDVHSEGVANGGFVVLRYLVHHVGQHHGGLSCKE